MKLTWIRINNTFEKDRLPGVYGIIGKWVVFAIHKTPVKGYSLSCYLPGLMKEQGEYVGTVSATDMANEIFAYWLERTSEKYRILDETEIMDEVSFTELLSVGG